MKFKLESAGGNLKKWTTVLKGFPITVDTSEKYTHFNIDLNSLEDFVVMTKLVGNKTVLYTYDNPDVRSEIMIYDGYLE